MADKAAKRKAKAKRDTAERARNAAGEPPGTHRPAARAKQPRRSARPPSRAAKPRKPKPRAEGDARGRAARGRRRRCARTRAAHRRPPPPKPLGAPTGTELVTTTIRAAGELAQIGFTLGGQVLKRAVDRIPRP